MKLRAKQNYTFKKLLLMKFLLMKVFLHLLMVLLIGLLIGCEGYHNSDLTPNKETDDVGFNTIPPTLSTTPNPFSPPESTSVHEVRDNRYQIGENWERKLVTNQESFAGQIFQLYRLGMGSVGTGFYIGKIAGKHLVMTAAHTYKDLVSCKDEINFIAKSKDFDFHFYCSGWSFQLKENDILFFEVLASDVSAYEKLHAVDFVNKKPINKGDRLKLLTIKRNSPEFSFDWFIDESSDCIVLSDKSRVLEDPDSAILESGESKIKSWSLPVGCDGMHGDSGAPVFNEDFKLVGVLWTGKYPKTNNVADIKNLNEDTIWNELNYIVPISKISDELHEIANNQVYLSLYTRNMIGHIADKLDGNLPEEEGLVL